MRQNYATFDFEKFGEGDLSDIKAEFDKNGAKVIDLEANNRSRRVSGYATKTAVFYFQDGQTITLRIKGDGDVYQVQMNGRVLPITEVGDKNKAIAEMARTLGANAPAWRKAQRSKQQRAKVNEKDFKARAVPRRKQIEEMESSVSQAQEELTELESENIRMKSDLASKEAELSGLKQQLEAE